MLLFALALCMSGPAEPAVAVVELFTSQGCSSCPPADKLLGALDRQPGVIALSFHVSYWDYIGWRDPYAQKAFDGRQKAYARKLGVRTYTPQMVVNGQHAFVGSDRREADTYVKKALARPAGVTISLRVAWLDGQLQVAYSLAGNPPGTLQINLALIQVKGNNAVKAGENRGRRLSHTNVVRVFKQVGRHETDVVLAVPKKLDRKGLALVVYAQDQTTLAILGATLSAL